MQSSAPTPQAYILELESEPDRQQAMQMLRDAIKPTLEGLGFEEGMGAGMINYWVPYSLYPDGYHCKPRQPLPFMAIAAQKHFIAVYHMGLYSDKALLEWFTSQYGQHTTAKLDMGKSCIRFKKTGTIPFDLFRELAQKISAQQWIEIYEQMWKR